MFRAVLFDFGYTLFGHAPGVDVVTREAHALGVALPADRATAIWNDIEDAAADPDEVALGRDLDAAVWRSRWRVLYGRADAAVPGLGPALDRSFHDPLEWQPYADTASALAALAAAGVAIGVASNTGWDIRVVFAAHGVASYVRAFTLSYECGTVKPASSFFHAACDALGVDASDTCMVGDDRTTDGRARDAGVAEVFLVDPHTPLGAPHGLDQAVAAILG